MSRRTVAISGLSMAGPLAPGLPVIRALRSEPEFAQSWRIVGLSYDPLDPPSYDRELVDHSYLLPYPSQGAERLFDRLRYIHAQQSLAAILPTLDSELPLYIRLLPRLRALGIALLLPSAAAFKRRSKAELPQLARQTGIRVPESRVARSEEEALKLAAELPLPLVVKGNLHGATVVHSLSQVAAAAQYHAQRWGYPVILQEFVPGIEYDVVALADSSSRLVGVVPMKKLQLDDRGKAWGALTIDDPSLCQAAEQAVSGLGWAGPLELELVRHRDSGIPYLIEVNPRFPAWVHLATAAGQNLPLALLRLVVGEPVARAAGYRVGVLQLRRSFDVTCALGAYESLCMTGEADPSRIDPAAVQPRFVALPPPAAAPPSIEDDPAPAPAKPAALPSWGAIGSDAPYERPSIVRHHAAIGNRFTGSIAHPYLDQIDRVPIESLVATYGSPLFVFSERTLRRRARAFRQLFSSRYPALRLTWSYKTNYLDAICGIFHQEGWDAEVVSELEYAMARRLGITGPHIVCNGAYKPQRWLEQAAAEQALVQIDHFTELDALEAVARRQGLRLTVGLRVNMQVKALGGGSWERFGFNLENGEILDAILRIVASDSLRLGGLHCHLGTFITDPAAYREATERLIELFAAAEQLAGYPLKWLNLGGGFPSSNTLAGDYQDGDADGIDLAPFAAAICQPLHDAFADRSQPPTLVLESGRHLVDDAGSLIATVVGTRRLQSGQRGVILDGGLNLLYTAHWYRHRVLPTQPVPGAIDETTLHGPLCMNIDVLRSGLPLPPLAPGHRVAIQPVGAYNQTQWMQFSQPRPAVVMITEQGTVELIRRAEGLADLKGPELLPAAFAPRPGAGEPS